MSDARPTFPERIDLRTVSLRRHEVGDAPRVFAVIADERRRLGEAIDWVNATESAADLARDVVAERARWDRSEAFDYALWVDDAYAGDVGLHAIDWTTGAAELGYWISGSFEGRGLVTEAARALTEVAFARGLVRVEVRCAADNLRSVRVAERLGFRLEGCLRGASVNPRGVRRDLLVFARLTDVDPRGTIAPDDAVVHWSAVDQGEESPYPDSVELFGARADLGRATGVDFARVEHVSLRPGRRGWRTGDPRWTGALLVVIDGRLDLDAGGAVRALIAGHAVRIKADFGVRNPGPAAARFVLVASTERR